jgi:hypothetical protein
MLIFSRSALTPIVIFVVCVLLAGACRGGGDSSPFFDPAQADALAHQALPQQEDLPGSGWEVTAKDKFNDEDEDDGSFEELIASYPSCSHLSGLAELGGLFGGDDSADQPAGRAQIEFERLGRRAQMPSSVEVEIEIEKTVVEVEGGFGIIKEVIESEDTKRCLSDYLDEIVEQEASGLQASMKPIDPTSTAPHEGAAMAFEFDMRFAGITLDGIFEMYFWPYGNAGVTVVFGSSREDFSSDHVSETLKAVDRRIAATAGKK